MDTIVNNPKWGFIGVVLTIAAIIVAIISIPNPRTRLICGIIIGSSFLISIFILIPEYTYTTLVLILVFIFFFLLQYIYPTVYEKFSTIILFIIGTIGMIVFIQFRIDFFLSSEGFNWSFRILVFICSFGSIILVLPFLILKSIKYFKDYLLINRIEIIIINLSFSVVGMCGIQSLILSLSDFSLEHYKSLDHNTTILIFQFLANLLCFYYVYLIWRVKKGSYISMIFGIFSSFGLWYIAKQVEGLNNYLTNNWIDILGTILVSIVYSIYYITIVTLEENRKALVRRRAKASVQRRASVLPKATINESDRVYNNHRAPIEKELPTFLNRKEPEPPSMGRLIEEEPTYKTSSSPVEKRRSLNLQKRNRKGISGKNGAFF